MEIFVDLCCFGIAPPFDSKVVFQISNICHKPANGQIITASIWASNVIRWLPLHNCRLTGVGGRN
ncbi:hypothetical protein M5D96_005580 [Drosophila gunungcola]|uniref:Uncharacterized protein n=1 Tax=Drosophila gunungcola TaxID=103775 RepID=A0A9P9YR13_9MUSC|nr:hypothetical protein M5D96_005580 [Drosophila gunungcola]